MVEFYVRVVGQVQGVFFRQSTKALADQLGIFGWVKNCSDGSVEALFQCFENQFNEMVTFLESGPTHAQVKHVAILYQKDCTKSLEGFTIMYE
jgi:acylphosphatase